MRRCSSSVQLATSEACALVVIAVTGARRCGKDVIADHLCNSYGFHKMRFADPLKRMVAEAFGFTHEQVDGYDKDVVDQTYGISPRRVLQFMGTEIMQFRLRELLPCAGRTFWAQRLLVEIMRRSSSSGSEEQRRIVISDMRFLHEYQYISSELARQVPDAALHVVKVERPVNVDACADAEVDGHTSETEWRCIPESIRIVNDRTLDDLRKCVDEFCAGVGPGIVP